MGDQVVLQFDMAVNAANCTRWDVSVDNYRYCASRPEGGVAFVDSLFILTGALGADYSGAWEDGSTFAITVIDPPPALAPRPYDTVLSIPEAAELRSMAGTLTLTLTLILTLPLPLLLPVALALTLTLSDWYATHRSGALEEEADYIRLHALLHTVTGPTTYGHRPYYIAYGGPTMYPVRRARGRGRLRRGDAQVH